MVSRRNIIVLFFLFSSFSLFATAPVGGDVEAEHSLMHLMTVLILQLGIIVIVSRLSGYLVERFIKLPKVLGELAAGMIIGPFALGQFMNFGDFELFPQMAEGLSVSPELYGFSVLASIVLLFLTGLETDLASFLKFSVKGSAVGIGGVIVSFFFGDMLAQLLPGIDDFMDPTALFLGTLSIATSVGITARILSEKRKMSSPEGVTILAAAVLDDVLGIVILAIVSGIAIAANEHGAANWHHISLITLKAFGFLIISALIGIFTAPFFIKGLKRFHSIEIISGVSFGIALMLAGFAETAHLAMIIGAFVAGLSLSQTDIAHELREQFQGLYQFLVPIFFVVSGMMVDFGSFFTTFEGTMIPVWLFGIVYSLVAIASKMVGCGLPALALGFNFRGALRVGAGMLPRGEVTLIMAAFGLQQGIISKEIFGVAVMTLLFASIIAPPAVIATFKGGSGYRAKMKKKNPFDGSDSIELEFASERMTEFVRRELLQGFRDESFFVHKMDNSSLLYHVRKDAIFISVMQKGVNLSINFSPENETFVRLLMVEQMIALKDLVAGIESMKNLDMMGADLMMGMFSQMEESPSEKA